MVRSSVIQPKDFYVELSKGKITGKTPYIAQGTALSFAAADGKVLLANVQTVLTDGDYTYLTAETNLYASSTSAADTVQTVTINGMDGNYNFKTATVTLTGQSQVLVGSFLKYRFTYVDDST